MGCRFLDERLYAYFDGELSTEEHNEMELHLTNCRECASALEELTSLREMLLDFGRQEVQAPPDLKENILSSLRSGGAFNGGDSYRQKTSPNQGRLAGLFAGRKWRPATSRWAAAAVGAILIGSTTWAWLSGNIDNRYPSVARNEKPSPTEKYNPPGATGNGTGENTTNNGPGEDKTTVQEPPATTPDKHTGGKDPAPSGSGSAAPAKQGQQIAKADPQPQVNATFLQVGKSNYTGYLTVKSGDSEEVATQARTLSLKYDATLSSDTGNTLKVNVPTASYGALFEELKDLLNQNGQLLNSSSHREDLSGAYRDALTALEQTRFEISELKSADVLTDEQREQLSRLQKKENTLLQQIEQLDLSAGTSTIIIKY